MQARELMTQPVVSVRPDASLAEAAETMVKCRVGCVTVIDEESRLRGIITCPMRMASCVIAATCSRRSIS